MSEGFRKKQINMLLVFVSELSVAAGTCLFIRVLL